MLPVYDRSTFATPLRMHYLPQYFKQHGYHQNGGAIFHAALLTVYPGPQGERLTKAIGDPMCGSNKLQMKIMEEGAFERQKCLIMLIPMVDS